ncbi:EspG family protein [Nocardia nova SH22a]|uniref:EspG family protein n=1 Tax=Nocardia nova SH22a TaxID=1415166 RepID=W5T937_9NOCA|nr:ESX secretion-associated protein EspG [Nocardia nova]AHH15737.1 EspG family protein [Nocardia nova SH22a]
MTRSWNFTDLEFVVMWRHLAGEGPPRPFVYTTDIPLEDDFQRECTRLRDRMLARPDHTLFDAVREVTQPDIAVLAWGFDGHDPHRGEGAVRILAARREDRGYLLTQLPGRTLLHAGGFTMVQCDPLRLADMIADALPEVESGDSGHIVLPPDQESKAGVLEAHYVSVASASSAPQLWDSYDEPEVASGQRFLDIVPERSGTIEIAQGISRFGPRGRTIRHLSWRDHPGDGRYVIQAGPPRAAVGVDRKGLIAAINAEIITVVRAIKDERA